MSFLGGIAIDLVYGLVMAGVFLLLFQSLPGDVGLVRGMSFALLVWFFRVVMGVASTWMMFDVPAGTLLYTLVAGLAEMLILLREKTVRRLNRGRPTRRHCAKGDGATGRQGRAIGGDGTTGSRAGPHPGDD